MMNKRFSFLLFLFFFFSGIVVADDIGVVETRLIEEEHNTYVLEVDVPPNLLNTIQAPILPARCNFIGEPELIEIGPTMVVRFRFTSGNSPLQAKDEILLFWQRTGIVLTAYWKDGTSKRVFVNRDLTGIRVPVSILKDVVVNTKIISQKSFTNAFKELKNNWLLYVLLLLASVLVGTNRQFVRLIFAFIVGHGLSLVATDFGISTFFSNGMHFMMAFTILGMLITIAYKKSASIKFWPVFIVLGLWHALAYEGIRFDQPLELTTLQQIVMRFSYNMVFDIAFIIVGLAFLMTSSFFKKKIENTKMIYVFGGLSVALLLILLPKILSTTIKTETKELPNISRSIGASKNAVVSSETIQMENPLEGFVTVTPFEIRCEWLVRAKDLQPNIAISEDGMQVIPIAVQEGFMDSILKKIENNTELVCDGEKLVVSYLNTDFVSVGNYGVTTRQTPRDELLEEAVVGITLAYAVNEAPKNVSLNLKERLQQGRYVPIAFTDPWGTTPNKITANTHEVSWKRRMAGFRRPIIKAVVISKPTWPIGAVICVLLVILVWFFVKKWHLAKYKKTISMLLILLAIAVYPFARIQSSGTLSKISEKQSTTMLQQLLTNIYQAFDYRSEEAIYDQLAISATGDQLTSIYLEQLSAMELEERGGARASVDNVEVLEIRELKPVENGFKMDASWVVSGSVSHFGHIHYRKNRYNAWVYVIPGNGAWKISGMEVQEKERIF